MLVSYTKASSLGGALAGGIVGTSVSSKIIFEYDESLPMKIIEGSIIYLGAGILCGGIGYLSGPFVPVMGTISTIHYLFKEGSKN